MKIPYGRQHISEQDVQSVVEVLKSDFLTQGPTVKKFEETFAKAVGAKYAVAFCNATAALHCGFKVLNKDVSKKVLVTPITFAASSNCVLYENGKVEFVDIDSKTFNIDINILEEKIRNNPNDYQGIIPVDFAGLPVNTEELRRIADKYGLWIMEDACHAVGGGFSDSENQFVKCGSNKFSDLTVFSFHPVKHIATGEGGMLTTNSEEYYRRLIKLRSHGIEKNPEHFESSSHGDWYHEMQELGYNYRLSDIHAALGISQLQSLTSNIERRNAIAQSYKKLFDKLGITYQTFSNKYQNAYHLFVIQTNDRKSLYNYLKSNNIFTQVHYLPVYKHPYYQKNGFKEVSLKNAEAYYDKTLSLPMYHGMTAEELNYVLTTLQNYDYTK